MLGGQTNFRFDQIITGRLVKADVVVRVTYDQGSVVAISPDAAPATTAAIPNPLTDFLYLDWVDGRWEIEEVGPP